MKNWWRRVRPRVIGGLAAGFIRLLGATFRITTLGEVPVQEPGKGMILCVWHALTLPSAQKHKHKGIWALFSLSKDGELQSKVFQGLGYRVIRGSTGRGGARALVECIRVLKQGDVMAITPDGPRGPDRKVQPGVLVMAQKSGAMLVPLAAAARPCWFAPSWDRYVIPFPFARVVIAYGKQIEIAEDSGEEGISRAHEALQSALESVEEQAWSSLGVKPKRGRA
ncbi:MAG: lysophospholipid acyltransferase family protein [Fimbriimonadaceae bacterium]|nr:lysophospholipid acyltransferase family protein [Fimbriimonadaceae bacterium]